MISRRALLAGAMAGIAQAALALPPERSPIPVRRPDGFDLRAIPSLGDLIARAELGGAVSAVVADARTGEVLESASPLAALPPASVTKALTAAYGLERLGPGYRFRTRVLADGVLSNGRLQGDLWLVGGGDPLLDTDRLNDLAQALAEAGLREVTGQLKIATAALPAIHEIDPAQPAHVGYNPAISGLNLNFNRVHFEWQRAGGSYNINMDARSESLRPAVRGVHMQIVERDAPVYAYSASDFHENWTVARGALGDNGSRWLPVRRPALYAAEVFQVLARARGIVLDGPELHAHPPNDAVVMAEHISEPLEDILRGMMRWSTNLTAEVVGVKATQAGGGRPESLAQSAEAMNGWLAARYGVRRQHFVDHSGLGVESRITTREMVRALVGSGASGGLRRIMKPITMRDADGTPVPDHPVEVVAKTGTLYFVSTLAGFARAPSGRDLAFAIFCGDLERRASFDTSQVERPSGSRSYNRRAKRLQQAMIERWGAVYA